jgi:hypothetical protein
MKLRNGMVQLASRTSFLKRNLFCHSERSEESLFDFARGKKERFLALLGMTKSVGPFLRSLFSLSSFDFCLRENQNKTG